VVVLPGTLLATAPAVTVPTAAPVAGAAPSVALPGADAEANSNVLRGRSALTARDQASPAAPAAPAGDEDPLIAAAEQAVRADTAAQEAVRAPEPTLSETTMELMAPVVSADEPVALPDEPTASGTAPVPDVALPAQATTDPYATTTDPYAGTPDPYAIGPDSHERVSDEEPERVTDKGLPKRTPKISAPAPVPRPRVGGVDAEALRRRLGGFHRGATDGRRDVEAEIAEQTGQTPTPHDTARNTAPDQAQGAVRQQDAVDASGGTVEEASS
jgi:hypothetical protein